MSIVTNGLVIKVNNIGEYNRVISVLTESDGLLHAFVHGARGIKNKNNAGTSLLSYSHFVINRKKDTYIIAEAVPEKVFLRLRGDIYKLTLAQHFCELASYLAPTEENGKEYLRLLLNSIYYLSEETKDPLLIKAITELRMLCLSGYAPDLVACRECAKFEDEIMYFDVLNGQIVCSECAQNISALIPCGKGIISALRHIVYSEFSKLYGFSLSQEGVNSLSNITEIYLKNQVEGRFASLEFLKSL